MQHHVVGVCVVAQQLCHFASQIDEPTADVEVVFGVVVQADRVFRHIHLPAQLALRGIGHEGRVGGRVERENPAVLTLFPGRLRSSLTCRFGQSVELFLIGDVQFESLVFLQQVLRELQREQAGLLGEMAQAFLVFVAEQRTTSHKTVVAVAQQHFLFGRQRFGVQLSAIGLRFTPKIIVINPLDALEKRLVEHHVVFVLREDGSQLLRELVELVVGFGAEHVREHGRYAVEQVVIVFALARVHARNGVLESGLFGVVDGFLNLLIVASDALQKGLFVVFKLDSVEGNGVVRRVVRLKKRVYSLLIHKMVSFSLINRAKIVKFWETTCFLCVFFSLFGTKSLENRQNGC